MVYFNIIILYIYIYIYFFLLVSPLTGFLKVSWFLELNILNIKMSKHWDIIFWDNKSCYKTSLF